MGEVKEAGFNNSIHENDESHKEEIEILVTKVEDAKNEISELSEALARTRAEHITKIDDMLAQKKDEVNVLQDKISERDRVILDFESNISDLSAKITDLETSAQDETKLMTAKFDRVSVENEELRGKKRELESSVRRMENEMETVSQTNSELSVRIIEKEQQYKEVRTQVESMRVTYEKHQRELNERLERSVQENSAMSELQVALDGERLRVDELQVALGEVESERDSLLDMKDKIELTQRKLSEVEEREILLLKDIDDIKGKHAFAQAEFEKERDELNDVVTKSKLLLQEKIDEFSLQKRAYDGLLSENSELNSYKRTVLILEQEKRELECKINTYRESSPALTNDSSQDPEGLKSQVDFLNSVIVDMQRKNDELKGKLDLLESAGILETIDLADMALLNGIDTNRVAPRLFCDICDQFDLHDTEDCPTQAMPDPEEEMGQGGFGGHTKSGGQ